MTALVHDTSCVATSIWQTPRLSLVVKERMIDYDDPAADVPDGLVRMSGGADGRTGFQEMNRSSYTYPGVHGVQTPNKAAVVMAGDGATMTHGELNDRSNKLAQFLFEGAGLRAQDHIALLAENRLDYLVFYFAAVRSGLYITPINRYLQAEEVEYILRDCGARALFVSRALLDVAVRVQQGVGHGMAACRQWVVLDAVAVPPGFQAYNEAVGPFPTSPLENEQRGGVMFYSSGSTGRPKGIKKPLDGQHPSTPSLQGEVLFGRVFGLSGEDVYLSPAPLYHAAPLTFVAGILAMGGTVVVMEKFDAELALKALDFHRATCSQWVPTMLQRMLKLPDETRAKYDLSAHRVAIHAAAPCPQEVKRRMIEWWAGCSIMEYYGGSEMNGLTVIRADEWLAHPGSVGRALLGKIHVCSMVEADMHEVAAGTIGLIFFEREEKVFEYHNDATKTANARHPAYPLWTTLGDVGYMDADGYLYLTDRQCYMIISGGVNIYPQEIEDCLVMHPYVMDAAVFGVPNEEMGEEVKAVVKLAQDVDEALASRELTAYMREKLAHYKVPKTIDFTQEFPRLPTGKLYKRLLRDQYWGTSSSKILFEEH